VYKSSVYQCDILKAINISVGSFMEYLSSKNKSLRIFTCGVLGVMLLLANFSSVWAQTKAEIVDCFDYYKFNSVQADISSASAVLPAGVEASFTATFHNENPYPIVGGSLYVKVFKKQADASAGHRNADLVVDQFFALEGIALDARATLKKSFAWKVPAHAETGEYSIASFFVTNKKFNLLGLSFTDDVIGNSFDFKIEGTTGGSIVFDKNAVTMNGDAYRFAAFPPRFGSENIEVQTIITNTTRKTQEVPVTWKLYYWDGLDSERLLTEKKEMYVVPAGGTQPVSFVITQNEHSVYYLVGELVYEDTKSVIGMRAVRTGVNNTRINFPSLTKYPLREGEANSIFSCAHATVQEDPSASLKLSLKDSSGYVIHSSEYRGAITGDMMGLKSNFVPAKHYDNVTLYAELYRGSQLVDSAVMPYQCDAINPKYCTPRPYVQLLLWILIAGVIALGVGLMVINRRNA